jgi:hypothetical protein
VPIVGEIKERVTVKPHPGGVKGALMSLDAVAAKMWASRNDPRVRAWTTQQLAKAGNPTGIREKAQTIVDAYRKKVPYTPDPVQSEFMASPVQTLCLDEKGLCIVGGDCDDATITVGACLLSIGIPVQVVGASYRAPTDQPVHVYLQFQDNAGTWVPVDPTTKYEVGYVNETARTWIVEPNKGIGAAGLPGGDFVSVGRAPSFSERTEMLGLRGRCVEGFDFEPVGDLAGPAMTPAQRIADARHSISVAQTIVQNAQSVVAQAQANEAGRAWWEHPEVLALVPFLQEAMTRACAASSEAAQAATSAATCDAARGFATSASQKAAAICGWAGCCGNVFPGDSCGIQGGTLDTAFYRCVIRQVNAAASAYNDAVSSMLACAKNIVGPATWHPPIPVAPGPRVPVGWAMAGVEPMGLGVVTPGDVIAYRTAWNRYVMDTVASANSCASAYQAVAAKQTDASTKALLTSIGQATQKDSDALLAQWNVYAGKSDAFIVLEASNILQSYQETVMSAGRTRENITTGSLMCALTYQPTSGKCSDGDPPSGTVCQAAPGVDPNVQAQIISRIEGLGILASGVLQILVDTAGNSLAAVGSATQWTAQQVGGITKALSTPWPWIALAAGAGAFVVWEMRR